jgi:predicted molibdopterin-dependent oxidoreductase YjgC
LVRRGEEMIPVGWSEALDIVANRLDLILDESGGGATAVIGGAHGTNEDAYALSKFARTVLGTNHVDARLDDGLASQFLAATIDRGLIADVDAADTILVWGPDLKETHPTLYLRVRRAAQELGVNLVVIHPRRTGLDDRASVTLNYRPGGGAELLAELAAEKHPEVGALLAGNVVAIVGQASLADGPQLAESVAALVRERADRARIIPLASRGNTYGALDMGLAPDLLPGRVAYRSDAMIETWGELPEKTGMTTRHILESAAAGEIRALVLVGSDPVGDVPHPGLATDALELAEYVVSIDNFLHESNRHADVVFPAAGFSEKEGTVTNLEGRVQKINKIAPAPGQSRTDWAILDDISSRMGKPMGFASAESITKEIAAVAPAYAGVTWDLLEWEARDGVVLPLEDVPVLSYIPVVLDGPKTPGSDLTLHSSRVMYDNGVRLRNCPSLRPLAPGAVAYLNSGDAKRLGAQDGYQLRVVTSKGEGEFSAVIDRY